MNLLPRNPLAYEKAATIITQEVYLSFISERTMGYTHSFYEKSLFLG